MPRISCWSFIREEFRLRQLRLLHPDAADFAQSPWFGLLAVLLYRFIIAAFCIGWMVATTTKEKWFIFLSNWDFFFVTLYFICATIVTAIHLKSERKLARNKSRNHMENKGNFVLREKSGETAKAVFNENIEKSQCSNLGTMHGCKTGEEPPSSDALEASRATSVAWFHKTLWVIYNAASAGAILITVIFWCLLFNESHGISAFSIIVHGVNAALVISETLLSSIPVRLLHVVYPMCLGIVYIVFTLVYWVSGGTNRFGMPYIYPQTDYTGRPVFSAISQLCLLFIGVPLSQCLMFCFYGLRVWIKAKYAK